MAKCLDRVMDELPALRPFLLGTPTIKNVADLRSNLKPATGEAVAPGTGLNYIIMYGGDGTTVKSLCEALESYRAVPDNEKPLGLVHLQEYLQAHLACGNGDLLVVADNSGETAKNPKRPLDQVRGFANPLTRVGGKIF